MDGTIEAKDSIEHRVTTRSPLGNEPSTGIRPGTLFVSCNCCATLRNEKFPFVPLYFYFYFLLSFPLISLCYA